ncbi:Pyruvate, phosphate dikinase [Tritrichomonas foetus]|uniref:Pyruvate, phosphate dikinase n=1 Tax=Tritrichomonas foetus TaxID=1144522 RepID=A0A1J4JPN3_9EUKA|nr:Pyruvate, phosphate dikinase [Tritrichomonas foetus]|eukprot:OHT00995.1 Pyruvate, phosphate dikinase [Tritrichomonas foetus]
MAKRFVYSFNEIEQAIEAAGSESNVHQILGQKGANLALISRIDIPVPKGFTITTEACTDFYKQNPPSFPPGMWEETLAALHRLEEETGKKFGDSENPLIVSCRAGGPVPVEGLLPTVLNLGLNDETAVALSNITSNGKFVWDNYRRLIHNYGTLVLGIHNDVFEYSLEQLKKEKSREKDEDITPEEWQQLVQTYKKIAESESGTAFPQDPFEQIRVAIAAVFNSWNSKEAVEYRRSEKIEDEPVTAASIIAMVFGNTGDKSCTGDVYTRNPETGENSFYGEFLINANGDELKKRVSEPMKISEFSRIIPEPAAQFVEIAKKLEKHFKDMQHIEFVVENSKLWILSTLSGNRTAAASVKMACDMVTEGLLTKDEAILRVNIEDIGAFIQPHFTKSEINANTDKVFAKGIPNFSPSGSGQIYFSIEKALSQNGILVQNSIPDDYLKYSKLKGIISEQGGTSSHVVNDLKQIGIPSVVGVYNLQIDSEAKTMTYNDVTLKEGDTVSIDGSSGTIFNAKMTVTPPSMDKQEDLKKILGWADEARTTKGKRKSVNGSNDRGLMVYSNVDSLEELKIARSYGAEGIGLCRTENLLDANIIKEIEGSILAEDSATRDSHFTKVGDFLANATATIFKEAGELPVMVRMLNPPISKYLPNYLDLLDEFATLKAKAELGQNVNHDELTKKERVLDEIKKYTEETSMVGFKGVRLCIKFPSFAKISLKAIIEGACIAAAKGTKPKPYIIVPFVCHENEMARLRAIFEEVKAEVFKQRGVDIPILLGAEIAVPRAAIVADKIAEYSDFLSFDGSELSQMAFCYSRDDAEASFVQNYRDWSVLLTPPYMSIDQSGIGQLMESAVAEGRKTKSGLIVGMCGEIGGDTLSIEFCNKVGADYISSGPYKVLISRLAAAQALLKTTS